MSKLDMIEDYLCDMVDTVYHDNILCDKDFIPSVPNCRAITVTSIKKGTDDLSHIEIYDVTLKAVRSKRSQAVIDFNIGNEMLPFYGKKVNDLLAISANLTYSIPPTRIMIDNKNVYVFSVNFKVTII